MRSKQQTKVNKLLKQYPPKLQQFERIEVNGKKYQIIDKIPTPQLIGNVFNTWVYKTQVVGDDSYTVYFFTEIDLAHTCYINKPEKPEPKKPDVYRIIESINCLSPSNDTLRYTTINSFGLEINTVFENGNNMIDIRQYMTTDKNDWELVAKLYNYSIIKINWVDIPYDEMQKNPITYQRIRWLCGNQIEPSGTKKQINEKELL